MCRKRYKNNGCDFFNNCFVVFVFAFCEVLHSVGWQNKKPLSLSNFHKSLVKEILPITETNQIAGFSLTLKEKQEMVDCLFNNFMGTVKLITIVNWLMMSIEMSFTFPCRFVCILDCFFSCIKSVLARQCHKPCFSWFWWWCWPCCFSMWCCLL